MAKYVFSLIGGLLFWMQFVCAQEAIDSSKIKSLRSFIKISISWDSGLEWEKKISKSSVINFFGGVAVGPAADGFSISSLKSHLIIVPALCAGYRNYYNLVRRLDKNKNTRNNAANFFYGKIETLFPIKNQNYFNLLISEGWGLQRSLGKKISFSYLLGIIEHCYYDKPPIGGFNYVKLEPELLFSFFYVF